MKKTYLILAVAFISICIIISVLWKKGYIDMKLDISEKEKALLANTDELNRAIENHQFEFTNKKIENVEISGMVLSGTDMINLALLESSIKNSKLEKVQVRGVDFVDVKLTDSEIRDTIFDHCTFTRSTMKGLKLQNTTFKDCSFNKTDFDNSPLDGCDFRRIRCDGLDFYESDLFRCSFNESDLHDFRIMHGRTDNLHFERNSIEKFDINLDYADKIIITDSTLSGSITPKEVKEEIKIQNCKGGFSFMGGLKVPRISVVQCTDLEALSTENVEIGEIILDCRKITSLYFDEKSNIKNVSLKNCAVDNFEIENTDLLFDKGYFSKVKFGDFRMFRSKVKNITLQECSINAAVVLKNVTIENLIILNTSFAEKIENIQENVKYINSMEFPVKK